MRIKFINISLTMIFLVLISVSCGPASVTEILPVRTLEISSTPTKPSPTASPTIEETQSPACLPSLASDVSLEGGILFYEYVGSESPDKTRVWLWSKNIPTPQTILEIPANVVVFLSPNGKKLVWHEYGTEHFTIFDLASKEQNDFNWASSWRYIRGWKDNETVSILANHEDIFEVGTKERSIYFDVSTKTIKSEDISLNLPGYTLGSDVNAPMDGFAITDPTGSVVIYTGYVDETPTMFLIESNTGKILWENKVQYPYYPPPDWTLDGKRVAFVIYGEARPAFYVLSQDGKTSEFIGEGASQRVVRDIKWSPDEKYIYYSYWNAIDEGPASIVNMDTKESKKICTPGYTFLRGTWLPNNYFAYIVREGEQTNQDGLAELRVLDPEDWTYQTLFRTNAKVGPTIGFLHRLEILGWTPLLNP